MLPYLTEHFGNPSSVHRHRRAARAGLDEARETVAELLGRRARRDRLHRRRHRGRQPGHQGRRLGAPRDGRAHVVTRPSSTRRCSHACAWLERLGFEVDLPAGGRDTAASTRPTSTRRSGDHTALVSVMHANNEVGTIQPIEEIARDRRASAACSFHTDAVQAAGYLPLDVDTLRRRPAEPSRATSSTAQGRGCAVRAAGHAPGAAAHGGGAGGGRRAGTENVAGDRRLRRGRWSWPQADLVTREAENARLARLRDRSDRGPHRHAGRDADRHATIDCRTAPASWSMAWRAGTWWRPWTWKASPPRPAAPAPPGRPSRATSCWRWASSRSRRMGPCG